MASKMKTLMKYEYLIKKPEIINALYMYRKILFKRTCEQKNIDKTLIN